MHEAAPPSPFPQFTSNLIDFDGTLLLKIWSKLQVFDETDVGCCSGNTNRLFWGRWTWCMSHRRQGGGREEVMLYNPKLGKVSIHALCWNSVCCDTSFKGTTRQTSSHLLLHDKSTILRPIPWTFPFLRWVPLEGGWEKAFRYPNLGPGATL